MSVLPVDSYLTITPLASVIGVDARQYAQIFVRVFASFIATAYSTIQEFKSIQCVLNGLTLFRFCLATRHATTNRIFGGDNFGVSFSRIHFQYCGEIRSLPAGVSQCVGHENLHRSNTINPVGCLFCLAHRVTCLACANLRQPCVSQISTVQKSPLDFATTKVVI